MPEWLLRAHPVLFAVAPVLALYAHNAGEVRFRGVAWILVVVVVLSASFAAAAARLLRDSERGALFASAAILLFFQYGLFFDHLAGLRALLSYRQIHGLLGVLCLASLLAVAIALRRARRGLENLSWAATVASCALVAFAVARLPAAAAARPVVALAASAPATALAGHAGAPARRAGELPDVYYVILDGYAREDVLARLFGFDNSPFRRELEQRGFFVASRSMANYPMTHWSLASSLSMRYLDDELAALPAESESSLPFIDLMRRSEVGRRFQQLGYKYIHLSSSYSGTETSDIADEVVQLRPFWLRGEFLSVLARSTALRAWEPSLAEFYLDTFRELARLPSRPGPKFVFVHLTVPHNPYVFDRDGGVRNDVPMTLQWTDGEGRWVNRRAYLDQLVAVNRLTLETVDALIRGSSIRPVIVLQADHGSAALFPGGRDRRQWQAFFWERFAILNAVLAPDSVSRQLDEALAPVNTFRVLFNGLFDAELELLPNRQQFGWYNNGSRHEDVTDLIAGSEAPAVR